MEEEKVYCVECGCEFAPDHQNRLDGMEEEMYMCDECMMEDAG